MSKPKYDSEMNVLQVGKSGLTEGIIAKAKEMLKKHKIIKVKFLPTAISEDKKTLAAKLAEHANARIKQRIGFTAVLVKKSTASNK